MTASGNFILRHRRHASCLVPEVMQSRWVKAHDFYLPADSLLRRLESSPRRFLWPTRSLWLSIVHDMYGDQLHHGGMPR